MGCMGAYDGEIDGLLDGLPSGVHDPRFTGSHQCEYTLWHNQHAVELTRPADTLNLDVRALKSTLPGM